MLNQVVCALRTQMDPTRRLPDQALEIGVMDRERLDSEEEDGSSDDEGDGGGGLEDAEPGPMTKETAEEGWKMPSLVQSRSDSSRQGGTTGSRTTKRPLYAECRAVSILSSLILSAPSTYRFRYSQGSGTAFRAGPGPVANELAHGPPMPSRPKTRRPDDEQASGDRTSPSEQPCV